MTTSKKVLLALSVVLVLVLAWYGISPLFRNVELNEELPDNINIGVESKEENMDEADGNIPKTQQEDSFAVMGTTGHPASGSVRVLETTDGKTIIRYEDFETINGPNLHVYLAKDLEANDYVDLGPIRGTRGNINYEVPDGVDISEYKYVMYWCVPFSVLFNYAEL